VSLDELPGQFDASVYLARLFLDRDQPSDAAAMIAAGMAASPDRHAAFAPLLYELWTRDWERRVRVSKFAPYPQYARARRGHIGLQDHDDRIAFRNIKIRDLS